jgi:GT2 family glycosyltransferase
MKVAIIFLDYERHTYSKQALATIGNAGYQFDLFTIDKKGIAAAINEGIDIFYNGGYDYLVTCANDIAMPDNWLKAMVEHANAIEQTGMIGIHCVESMGEEIEINGKKVFLTGCPFGNVLITKKAIETIGYFNTAYDPYGRQDSDFAYRLLKTGFTNYYLPNLQSFHIGHDWGEKTPYRIMKDEGLFKSDEIWNECMKKYNETKNYYL